MMSAAAGGGAEQGRGGTPGTGIERVQIFPRGLRIAASKWELLGRVDWALSGKLEEVENFRQQIRGDGTLLGVGFSTFFFLGKGAFSLLLSGGYTNKNGRANE